MTMPLRVCEVTVVGGCTARFVYVFLYNICILIVNLVVYARPRVVISARKLGSPGTRAAVFAGGVDGVDHRQCFQIPDSFEIAGARIAGKRPQLK